MIPDFDTECEGLDTAIAEMVYDGWSDDDIVDRIRRTAATIRAEMVAKIAAPPQDSAIGRGEEE